MKNRIKETLKSEVPFLLLVAMVPLMSCGRSESHAEQELKAYNSKLTENFAEDDVVFMVKAAENYLQGIQLGRLALNQAKSGQVKDLAEKINKEKIESLDKLKSIAEKKLILIPADVPFEDLKTYRSLVDKKGLDFDKAYVLTIEEEQRQMISEFEAKVNELNDSDIRNWANASLPSLKSQLLLTIECRKQQGN